MGSRCLVVLLTLALACSAPSDPSKGSESPPGSDEGDASPPTTSTTEPPVTTVPSSPSDTADTGALTIPTTDVDCAAANPLPLATTTLAWISGSEDFAFDANGYELGVVNGSLFRTPFGGPKELVVPGLSTSIRGSRVMADGTVALADAEHQSIVGADPATGASWTIAANISNANGVAIGVDGWIYAATTGAIVRVDPATGATETVADLGGHSFDGLSFSPDYQTLFFDEEIGKVWSVTFDAAGNPGVPTVFIDLPIGAFSLLDGMTIDACGNLYVVEMGGKVWRVLPDATAEVAIDIPGLGVISAVNFGSGLGGYDRETIYVMDFSGKLYAADVGVPGKWEPYLP